MIRSIRCSLTRVILWIVAIILVILFVHFIRNRKQHFIQEKVSPKKERHLSSANLKLNLANIKVEESVIDNNADFDKVAEASKDDVDFIDVMRMKPKVTYSVKSTLDKLLEEERRIHNPSMNNASSKDDGSPKDISSLLGVSGVSVGRGPGNLSHLKASLKDPSFVKKIKNIEDRRQDLYLSILKKRGQVISHEDGCKTIVSYPQTPVNIPNNLKRDLGDWSKKEHIWVNITHFPWPLDQTCRKYSVTFGKPASIPIVGLASYPSSGNTWIRYLIEGVTGYYTGSMYNDIALRKKGFYGEGVPMDAGIVVTVKTHGHTTGKGETRPRSDQFMFNHHKKVNKSAILLIRDPFAAIIGHRNLDQGGHTGLAKLEQFRGNGWQEFVEIKAAAWLNFYSDWLLHNNPHNILVLHYENIKDNLRFSLRKIVDFLGFEEDQGRIDCAQKYKTGLFKRDHKDDLKENPFNEQQKDLVLESIMHLNVILKKNRKETLPIHKYRYLKKH